MHVKLHCPKLTLVVIDVLRAFAVPQAGPNKTFNPVHITSLVIKTLLEKALTFIPDDVQIRLVFAVPAFYDPGRRSGLQEVRHQV